MMMKLEEEMGQGGEAGKRKEGEAGKRKGELEKKEEKLEREKDELQMKLAVVEQTGDNEVQELLWAMISGWV